MDDEDFQRQLELEAAEAKKKEDEKTSDPGLYTDATGTVYEWDHDKKAWFPKVDDNFIALYQANYGFIDNSSANSKQDGCSSNKTSVVKEVINDETEESHKTKKRKKEEVPATWFEVDDEHNTNVYISGLPLDVTEEELLAFMSKCGLVMKDLETNKYKIKLYKDKDGYLKGDGLVSYIKVESVNLALQILDEADIHPGYTVHVERAKFTLKGEYDPNLKPKRQKKDRRKLQKRIDKLLDWRPEKLPFERPKTEKVVIIKNMFDISEFSKDPKLILEYRSDLREECEEKCGPVKKVEVYDNNSSGVSSVFFNDFDSADKCVALMNGRYFAGRKLTAEFWDGKTRYKVNESEEEVSQRIKEWDGFLQQD